MAIPRADRLIGTHPWYVFVVGTVIAVIASAVRELIHTEGTIRAGEGVVIAVTLAAGVFAIWALFVITLRRRAAVPR